MRPLGKPALFVVLYILFLIPTYLLPYFGSNSAAIYAVGAAAGEIPPQLIIHFLALLALVLIALGRGKAIGKLWLVIFPILAAFFDLVPGMSSVPLVVTVLHILAITLGLTLAPKPVPETPTPGTR